MKRLVINGEPSELFFEENATQDEIFIWVAKQMLNKKNLFELNEQHSCSISCPAKNFISIYGDEDSMDIEIENIKT